MTLKIPDYDRPADELSEAILHNTTIKTTTLMTRVRRQKRLVPKGTDIKTMSNG